MEEKLTLELLKEVKANAKKWFVISIILLVILFASNMAWLYYWNLPSEEVTTQIDQANEDEGDNNYIGNNGDINGSQTEDNNKGNTKK